MTKLVSMAYLQDIAEVVVLTNDEAAVRSMCLRVQQPSSMLHVLPFEPSLGPLIGGWWEMLNYSQGIPW